MAFINIIAHSLPHQVSRDRETLHAMFFKQVTLGLAVIRVGFIHFKVIAPTGQLDSIVTKILGLLNHRFQWQICPLASKKSNCS